MQAVIPAFASKPEERARRLQRQMGLVALSETAEDDIDAHVAAARGPADDGGGAVGGDQIQRLRQQRQTGAALGMQVGNATSKPRATSSRARSAEFEAE